MNAKYLPVNLCWMHIHTQITNTHMRMQIINTEQQADDMMIGIQLMIERSYSKEIGNSSLLASELLTAFKDHPMVLALIRCMPALL